MHPSFLPYQKHWIKDTSQIKLMEKSRQIGISWATAYSVVCNQFTNTNNSPSNIWISSRDFTQAKLFIKDCKHFATTLNDVTKKRKLSSTSPPPLSYPNPSIDGSSFTLQFAKKNTINAISSSPDAQAGKTGTRILDEFALHPDPHQLYTIAYPGITWGGQLQIISTHRGSKNFFNTLIQEILHNGNPKKISHHRVTLQDALDQGFLKTLQSTLPASDPRKDMDETDYFNFIRNSCPDEESFLQEYMCVPADYQSYFLCPNLVASCEYTDTTKDWNLPLQKLRFSPHDLYLGIDIGCVSDFTVLWLIEVVNNVYFTRHVRSLKTSDFNIQEKFLEEFTCLPNLRRICIDQTGMGFQFTQRAKNTFSPSKVEGVTFSKPLKEILAYTVRSALEKRTLFLPPDPRIRTDLLSLKRVLTGAGNVRLDAEHSSTGHADHFWALALALHATNPLSSTNYCFESFPAPEPIYGRLSHLKPYNDFYQFT